MTDFDDPLIGNDPTVGNGDHIERPARSTSPLEGGLMDLVTYYGSFVPTLRPEQTMRLPTIDDATALAREVLELRGFIGSLVQLHAWGTGAFEMLTAEDVWTAAEAAGIVAPDPHPQPCPIEECPCGEFDGDLWRLAWNPLTAAPPALGGEE